MEENKFCSAFDYAYTTKYKKFIEHIIKLCLTRAAVKRSLIVPKSMTEITSMKSLEDQTTAIQNHILRVNLLPKRLKELGSKSSKIYTLARGGYYTVTLSDDKILLNDVEIEVVQELGKTTLYIAKDTLVPNIGEYKERTEKGSRKCRYREKICDEDEEEVEEEVEEEYEEEDEPMERAEEGYTKLSKTRKSKRVPKREPKRVSKSRIHKGKNSKKPHKKKSSKISSNKKISKKKIKISKDAESLVKTIMI
jgi:hypothetical protein